MTNRAIVKVLLLVGNEVAYLTGKLKPLNLTFP